MRIILSVVAMIIASSCTVKSFTSHHGRKFRKFKHRTNNELYISSLFDFTLSNPKIPKSVKDRDNQAISGIKAAIQKKNISLIECEFPPLESLNKLGDGSLRSAIEVEEANIAFLTKLVKGLSLPFGPKINILISSAASNSFQSKVASKVKGGSTNIYSLKDDSLSNKLKNKKDVCILLTPSSGNDFKFAKRLAASGQVVIIVNAFAKDKQSITDTATMGYFLKPLTYNSQVAGYLIRIYPSDWTVFDASSNEVLGTFSDSDIRVKDTNTPDLRKPVKMVQAAFDKRAISARLR